MRCRFAPKGFSDLPEVEYDVVVVICDDGWPGVRAKRWEHWNVPAPKGLPPERFRAVRDQIACKVEGLLARLSVSLDTAVTRPEHHRKELPRAALECQMTKSGG